MTRSGRKVTVEEATLNVVGVSIKALQIGKKQMTLSVFRQLHHSAVWDPETRKPKGIVWGRVNYFWNGDSNRSYAGYGDVFESECDPIHIVWQEGSKLRRSYLFPDIGEDRASYPLYLPREGTSYRPCKVLRETRKVSVALVRAWEAFYAEHIAASDQLFIAV